MNEIDTSKAPLGVMTCNRLVKEIADAGVHLERHYLEVKGKLDLSSRADVAKLAKFMLGAANRNPNDAARHFEGYGVMVVGIDETNSIIGVSPIEILTITSLLRKYVGEPEVAPKFDLTVVKAANGINEVLVFAVDPPKQGDAIFVCRGGGDGIEDGQIFIRAEGQTRPAKSSEIDMLLNRMKEADLPGATFSPQILEPIPTYTAESSRVLDAYIEDVEAELLAELPQQNDDTEPSIRDLVQSGMKAEPSAFGIGTHGLYVEKRTPEEFREQVANWAVAMRLRKPEITRELVLVLAPRTDITIKNNSKRFFKNLRLDISVPEEIRVEERLYAFTDNEPAVPSMPAIPARWQSQSIVDDVRSVNRRLATAIHQTIHPKESTSSWNPNSRVLTIEIPELRSSATIVHSLTNDILQSSTDEENIVDLPWVATAEDHHQEFRGQVNVQVGKRTDLTSGFLQFLQTC